MVKNYKTTPERNTPFLVQRILKLALLFLIVGTHVVFAHGTTSDVAEITKNIDQATKKVSGKVLDAHNGEGVIGATVMVKGTSTGVATDLDGNFTLDVTDPNAVLVIRCIGYTSVEVPLDGKTSITISLNEESKLLDEVVVVAYGTQRKSSVTGAITTVRSESLTNVTAPSVTSMLQGKVAGVTASQDSGKPGEKAKLTIRGKGSISSTTEPLWVVDGVVGGMTSELNPNDIESLTVLKDGSATALYGSRGANGVIIVTTKTAYLGTNNIDVSIKAGLTTATRGRFKVQNSAELYDYTLAAYNNAVGGAMPSWFTPDLVKNDTDWWDIATQTALTQNYNVAYRTGSDKLRSYLSGDYYKEEGVVKGFDYERFTVRSNLTYKFNDRLSIRTNLSGSYNTSDSQERSIYSALTYLPWDTPYNTLGEIKTGREGQTPEGKDVRDYWLGRDKSNYLYDLQYNWTESRQIGVDGTFGFDYKIIDGLVFESTNSIGFRSYISDSYTDPNSLSGESLGGTIQVANNYYNNKYANQLLRYARVFNEKHDVSAFLGFEYNDSYTRTQKTTGNSIPVGAEVTGVAASPGEIPGDKYTWKAMGYYFNTNYVFDDRYSAQFSFRRDGSSKFGKNNKYGNFFTVGAGWNAHNETFLKDIALVNVLKLRGSYGRTGNTPDAAFSHMGLYQINMNYNGRPSAFPYQMANRNMTWETAYTTNVGIDARLFDRLGISAEFYIKNTSGLLYMKPLSALSGYSHQWANEGKMKNTGFEVTLSPEIIKTRDWKWSIDFNIGYNKNKITELAEGKEEEVSGNFIRKVGYSLGTYYMKEWAGVDPLDGSPLWFAVDDEGNKSLVKSPSDATRAILGKRQLPNLTGGIQTNLSYKDFSLAASFAFATGFYINHTGRAAYDNDGVEIQYNSMRLHDGWSRWEKPGDVATHPQVKWGGNNLSNDPSSRYLERGDFFKMKSISVSYNVPRKALGNFGLKSAKVSLSGENLFTITEFSGLDPELGIDGKAIDAGKYSVPRRFSISFNLGF